MFIVCMRTWVQSWVWQNKSKQKIDKHAVWELAFTGFLAFESKMVGWLDMSTQEALASEPKCSRMQSQR